MLNRHRLGSLLARLGAGRFKFDVFAELEARYAEPHRAYHNAAHIADCLEHFDETCAGRSGADIVEAAIWFHDAIYDPKSSDNEERSAELAEVVLSNASVSETTRERIRNLILATKHDVVPGDPEAAWLVDIDLSILGREPTVFWNYERAIRVEYSWVPELAFRDGRRKILEHFLERPRIYSTEEFFTRYERAARENLRASIAALG